MTLLLGLSGDLKYPGAAAHLTGVRGKSFPVRSSHAVTLLNLLASVNCFLLGGDEKGPAGRIEAPSRAVKVN